ncbi:hypothetical protein EYF80_000390 [Liparis tanakae]|uniref:Uncharacterized protein n=1 Tax=Liparis tanakae TaxID=230148 RepID=A0A4Z2JIM2_9TELE|nr:hypothetical protein EYF80_000390 [Liparis tanakae]
MKKNRVSVRLCHLSFAVARYVDKHRALLRPHKLWGFEQGKKPSGDYSESGAQHVELSILLPGRQWGREGEGSWEVTL